jgi:glucuronoarabinoxylan endo-1,4-beta-xylanase
VDENKNNWTREVATAKFASERGHIVFASPWNPPSDMKETYNCVSNCGGANGNTTYRLRANKYADYAKHLDDFVTFMKNNGVELSAISIQNEPDYDAGWLYWTPTEIVNFLKNNASAIKCKIIAPESFQYVKSMSDPILNDAQALANMDILGAHLYGTQVSQFPYPLFKTKGAGKELWMTEVYVPNSEANSADKWPEALDVAQHVHNAMVEAEFQMYVWWYIRRSYSPLKEDGTISKRGYMMAHFSKFVRPGYVRIDATKTPETNVFVSAYKSGNKVVIVAVNKKTSASSMNFTVSGGAATGSVESWRTSGTENMAKATGTIAVSGGKFSASLPAQSVTTFVGTLGTSGGNTDINVTCNVDNLNASYVAGSSVPRPNVSCGANGGTAGAATFHISGSVDAVSGWSSPNGTNQLYNPGVREVVLNSLECGGVNVTPATPVSCGTIEILPETPTSVANLGGTHVRKPFSINVRGKTLFITAASPTVVEIYNIKGGKEASINISGATHTVNLSLPDGVYFAKARGMRDVKFVVR